MKRALLFLLMSAALAQAQMYDPFRKTAKLPVSAPGLLPPPPMIPSAPPPPPLEVSAVMNDRAFINGAWYRIGEKIREYEVTHIDHRFVGLREGNRLKMIGVGTGRRVLGTKDVP